MVLEPFARGSAERLLLKKVGVHLPKLRESPVLCLSRMTKASVPYGIDELHTFASLCADHGPLAARELHLDGNGFGDAGVDVIVPLLAPYLPHLNKLVLAGNAITADGVRSLIAHPPLRSLVLLDLAENAIDDAGLGALADAFASNVLRVSDDLPLQGNPASEEAREAAQRAAKKARKKAAAAAAEAASGAAPAVAVA